MIGAWEVVQLQQNTIVLDEYELRNMMWVPCVSTPQNVFQSLLPKLWLSADRVVLFGDDNRLSDLFARLINQWAVTHVMERAQPEEKEITKTYLSGMYDMSDNVINSAD